MAHLVIRHKVNNYPAWKKEFDGFIDTRRAGGEKTFQILYTDNDNNNRVSIFGWDSLENAKKFTNSSELKETMGNAGVVDQPDIYFLEEYTSGKI